MYGDYGNSAMVIGRELAILNIISIINTPSVWNYLDNETHERLIMMIANYAKKTAYRGKVERDFDLPPVEKQK